MRRRFLGEWQGARRNPSTEAFHRSSRCRRFCNCESTREPELTAVYNQQAPTDSKQSNNIQQKSQSFVPTSARGSGPGGRRFKSSLPDQSFQTHERHFWFFVYRDVGDFVDTYDAYGTLTAFSGTQDNPRQYAGGEFDPETGNYYNRLR